MPTLSLPAPAKLNLFLHICGRRDDGYHHLQTLFQLLDYGDELRLEVRDDEQIKLRCSGPQLLDNVPEDDNLVLRAARALVEHVPAAVPGADIQLLKRLPTGGGLGGGSSDAATTLLGLNKLWRLGLSIDELLTLGAELGADVPVFIKGCSAWGEGIGEKLTPVTLPQRWYLVIHPGCSIATKEIFSHAELTRDSPAITMADFFAGHIRNDCEDLVRQLAEPVDKSLIWLSNFERAAMTGTGACIFAQFPTREAAEAVSAQVPGQWQAFVARGVNRSPTLECLERSAL
ncbi:MAG: 4-diphosphocytidyl-2-C-methyl-D-erythritol kinase [Halieaceae bacterium]|jgi:4-diphosphocytidyl-2-C-methyl-D-erythritol kinase